MRKLANKVALITGGTRGIGKAISLRFADEGANIILNYVKNVNEAEKVTKLISEKGVSVKSIKADVSNKTQVENMVSEIISEFDKIDILVNNAGILIRSDIFSFNDYDLELMLAINLKGVIYCTKSTIPFMIKKNFGKIINISSIAGLGTAANGTTSYAATKSSVIILTKRFALELGDYNINVNAIAPGLIKTDMILKNNDSEQIDKLIKYCKKNSMLNRIGSPNDIANAALFLASEESNFITGQIISVDGGRKDFLTYSM